MRPIAALLLIFFFNTFACAAGWKGEFTIANISVEGSDNEPIVYINLIPQGVGGWPESYCQSPGYVTLITNTKRGEQAFSLALLASTTNKKIWVRFEPGCYSDRYIISGINLAN